MYSGFEAVASFLAPENPTPIYKFLIDEFDAGVRGNAFDRLVAQFDLAKPVADIVDIYRTHEPSVRIDPMLMDFIRSTKKHSDAVHFGIISDGPLASQQAKIAAIDASWADLIILTDAWGRRFWKPHPRAYETISSTLQVPSDACIYIGDNVNKDFLAPKQMGWHTVQLSTPWQQHKTFTCPEEQNPEDYRADVTLFDYGSLTAHIASWVDTVLKR